MLARMSEKETNCVWQMESVVEDSPKRQFQL